MLIFVFFFAPVFFLEISGNGNAPNGFANAVSVLSTTSTAIGKTLSQDESLRQAILEEEKALSKLKVSLVDFPLLDKNPEGIGFDSSLEVLCRMGALP